MWPKSLADKHPIPSVCRWLGATSGLLRVRPYTWRVPVQRLAGLLRKRVGLRHQHWRIPTNCDNTVCCEIDCRSKACSQLRFREPQKLFCLSVAVGLTFDFLLLPKAYNTRCRKSNKNWIPPTQPGANSCGKWIVNMCELYTDVKGLVNIGTVGPKYWWVLSAYLTYLTHLNIPRKFFLDFSPQT